MLHLAFFDELFQPVYFIPIYYDEFTTAALLQLFLHLNNSFQQTEVTLKSGEHNRLDFAKFHS